MRKLLLLLCLALFAGRLSAQGPPRRVLQSTNEFARALQQLSEANDFLSKSISRDAYIVAQMVKASGELRDFQKNAAIQKALDSANDAKRRAADRPPAGPETMRAVDAIVARLEHARENASMADPAELSEFIIRESHFIQRDLFRALDVAKQQRHLLAEIQKKTAEMNLDLESAMVEALSATFDFVRAGGK